VTVVKLRGNFKISLLLVLDNLSYRLFDSLKVEKVCHPEYLIFALNKLQVTDAL